MLRGLKSYTKNLTAIVTVADDGGGSGMLRRDLGMPAPGDIRNCMQALSNTEPLMERLLDYRFTEGTLQGQSFGNLLLAALNGISSSFDEAVSGMQQVLAITGRVLPVTADNVQLAALLENGARVVGESKIARAKQEENCRIRQISLLPPDPTALPGAISAIEEADLILLGPGSLYTSLIPNLLVPGIAEAIRRTHVPRIYVSNLMTQEGETEGYTVADHIDALYAHSGPGLFTACLVNSDSIPPHLLRNAWEAGGITPVTLDQTRVTTLGLELIACPLVSLDADVICHCPHCLTQAIRAIYESRAIQVYPDRPGRRYVLETD
ncbi:MAG: YvcK family protein [Firmicutes bacterium]|nr:YvcK family protein [Bacillota bacterium]